MDNDILKKIIKVKYQEVESLKKVRTFKEFEDSARAVAPPRDFAGVMSIGPLPRIIAECKQKSPSRGVLISPYDPVNLSRLYEKGGAAAISVLTDATFFGGDLGDLTRVRAAVRIPILRKDFIIDPIQVVEARGAGADSFLLLAGTLDHHQLEDLLKLGRLWHMEPLVEAHNEEELEIALSTSARIIGLNNRNLRNFSVDFSQSQKLVKRIIEHKRIAVCESGIKIRDDIRHMESLGFTGFLIGESLVTSAEPQQKLQELMT